MASYSAGLSPNSRAAAARSLTKRARRVASFRMWYIISFVGRVLSQRSTFPIVVALRSHAVRGRARRAERRGVVCPFAEQRPRLARVHDLLDPEGLRGAEGRAELVEAVLDLRHLGLGIGGRGRGRATRPPRSPPRAAGSPSPPGPTHSACITAHLSDARPPPRRRSCGRSPRTTA